MKAFYCAGNWKLNKSAEQTSAYLQLLKSSGPQSPNEQEEIIILPPALVAWKVSEGLRDTNFGWGGQNCYFAAHGAFTGENSPLILKEMGAKYCLVGHSERRQVFGEPDELIANKVRGVQQHDLTPILCVGETLDDRRWNRTQEVIVRQLKTALQNADAQKPLWLAYEPVWAIGTGQVATPIQVEEAHTMLRKGLAEWNPAAAERTPILYGGSVKSENAGSLAGLKNVNGFLIGGASLEVPEFLKIYKTAREARA